MQNGKIFFLMCIGAFYLLDFSNQIYSQTLEVFKEGVTAISEVKFKGLDNWEDKNKSKIEKSIYENYILQIISNSRIQILNNAKFKSEQVEEATKLIKESLYNIGYQDANVKTFGEKVSDDRARLIFSIEKGSLIHVSEIHFNGNKNISSVELRKTMDDCMKDSWKFFDKRHYEYCTQKNIRELMFSKGYFTARTGLKSQRVSDKIVVTVEIEEGSRYRIGELKIDGLSIFSEKQFLAVLGQKTGDIVDGRKLRDVLYETLKKAYADQGFILYDAEMDPEFVKPRIEGQDGIVNLKFVIDEGRRFKIRNILIKSAEPVKIQQIQKLLGLMRGEVFNQEKFENGIKRINTTKEFKFVDKDKDVEMRTDEESDDLDLFIKVSKK